MYSKDSTSSIRLQFAGQWRVFFLSRGQGSDNARNEDVFAQTRRLRLVLAGSVMQPELTYRVHLSAAPYSLELMDFYVDYWFDPQTRIRYGQYKVPFTRYRIQSFQRLTFADWAVVTRFFGAERQIGLSVHNGYERPPKWAYAVGVFTGVNARASHGVGVPLVYGESRPNPSDLADPAPSPNFHPEIFFHAALNTSGINVRSETDAKSTDLRQSLAFSAAWDFDPVRYQDFAGRFAAEVLAKYRGASCAALGYAGLIEIGESSCTKLGMVGGLVQAAYRINQRFEISTRYAVVDFHDDLIDDARARAVRLIDHAELLLYDADEKEFAQHYLDDLTAQYKNAGQVLRENEITVGFNIYLIEHSLKWQNDFGFLRHTRRDENRDDYLARTQFQVAF